MNCDVVLTGYLSGLTWRHAASSIVAIGQENQHALFCFAVVELLDGEANGIADHGLRTSHAGVGLAEDLKAGVVIERERCDGISGLSKHNQADTVALALADEVADHLLYRVDAAHAFAFGRQEIRCLHRLRDVERQHQVTARLYFLYGWFDELRACEREKDQAPADGREEFLQPVCFGNDRARFRSETKVRADVVEESETQRILLFLIWRQQPIDEEWQRKQRQQPWILKSVHGASVSTRP